MSSNKPTGFVIFGDPTEHRARIARASPPAAAV
jgi:hypothetical protein